MPYQPHPDYKDLPEPIKAGITQEEFAWLSDEQRTRLIDDMCLPDDTEDD